MLDPAIAALRCKDGVPCGYLELDETDFARALERAQHAKLKWSNVDRMRNLFSLARHVRSMQLGEVVEIGCWRGWSQIILALACRDRCWAIDGFNGGLGLKEGELQPASVYTGDYVRFDRNLKRAGVDRVVQPIVAWSPAAIEFWPTSLKIGLLCIDGMHTYEAARLDLESWGPLMIPGGWIEIDDVNEDFPGLLQLAAELADDPRWEPFATADSQNRPGTGVIIGRWWGSTTVDRI